MAPAPTAEGRQNEWRRQQIGGTQKANRSKMAFSFMLPTSQSSLRLVPFAPLEGRRGANMSTGKTLNTGRRWNKPKQK
jgi:hypothetical protein